MRNVSKYFLAIGLVLTFAGCTDEGGLDEEGSNDERTIVATTPLASGETMTVFEGPPDESLEPIGVAAQTQGCWVVLDWCVDPDTGGPTCTATGCTVYQAVYHCASLIDQYC